MMGMRRAYPLGRCAFLFLEFNGPTKFQLYLIYHDVLNLVVV